MGYLIIDPEPREKNHKTDVFTVRAEGSLQFLGQVRWWAHWRRYTFQPHSGTAFDAACLTEIAAFVQKITEEHKRKRLERVA